MFKKTKLFLHRSSVMYQQSTAEVRVIR